MSDDTTTTDRDPQGEQWTITQRGLDGEAARGQVTLEGGIAKAAAREGSDALEAEVSDE